MSLSKWMKPIGEHLEICISGWINFTVTAFQSQNVWPLFFVKLQCHTLGWVLKFSPPPEKFSLGIDLSSEQVAWFLSLKDFFHQKKSCYPNFNRLKNGVTSFDKGGRHHCLRLLLFNLSGSKWHWSTRKTKGWKRFYFNSRLEITLFIT